MDVLDSISPLPEPTPFGETPRLVLREFVPGDWQSVLAYASDAEVLRYRMAQPATPEQVQNGLAKIAAQRDAVPRTRYEMAIVRKDTGELIGWLPLLLGDGNNDAEIGWTLARAHWGHGYATEAACFGLQFAFETLNLHRVWARCAALNTASWRVMEKLKMRREGHHKQNQFLKGAWIDTFVYALLQEEWIQASPPNPLP